MSQKNNEVIVFLDAMPLINDNLDLQSLNELGAVTIYDYTPAEQVLERIQTASIVITNKVKLTHQHFTQLPQLKYIGVTATGVDNINITAAKLHNITVTNVPNYSTSSVAQHVIALLLSQTNQVDLHHQSIQKGAWHAQPHFSYWITPIQELSGLTMGLLGYGQVAQQVARVANSLGMNVIAHKPSSFSDDYASWVTFEKLLQKSDILSLHCPLTDTTRHIINEAHLAKMKKGSILINTGRGALIEEKALAHALTSRHLATACLDVLEKEPPEKTNPLLSVSNCKLTPHIAWASLSARKRLLNSVCENIMQYLNNKPINVI
jgi:glycerate dehydrogenase